MGQIIFGERRVNMPDDAIRGLRMLIAAVLQAGDSRWVSLEVTGEDGRSESLSVLVSAGVDIKTTVASGADDEVEEMNALWRQYFPEASAAADAAGLAADAPT